MPSSEMGQDAQGRTSRRHGEAEESELPHVKDTGTQKRVRAGSDANAGLIDRGTEISLPAAQQILQGLDLRAGKLFSGEMRVPFRTPYSQEVSPPFTSDPT